MSVKVTGVADLNFQLFHAEAAAVGAMEDVIEELAIETHGFAVGGILHGKHSGVIYTKGGKTEQRRVHQASAAGQYPANDTGRLAGSIKHEFQGLRSVVWTDLEYGKYLEYGTSTMAARPWLGRSAGKATRLLSKKLRSAYEAKR